MKDMAIYRLTKADCGFDLVALPTSTLLVDLRTGLTREATAADVNYFMLIWERNKATLR